MKHAEHWASETGVPYTVVESIQLDALRAAGRACAAAQADALKEAARMCEDCKRAEREQPVDPATCKKMAACAATVVADFCAQAIAELVFGIRRA
jgi:hypothetical protein